MEHSTDLALSEAMRSEQTSKETQVEAGEFDARQPGRGRDASRPQQIPWQGWKDIVYRVVHQVDDDNVFIVSAGVAFFAMAALFPALIALISIYGLFADPVVVEQSLALLRGILPEQGYALVQGQLRDIVAQNDSSLGWGLLLSMGGALWTASGGLRALVTGLNIAYDETEKRSILRVYLLTIGLTLGAMVVLVLGLGLSAAVARHIYHYRADSFFSIALTWPLMLVLFAGILSLLYRYGPSRTHPRWQWVSWGSTFAALTWGLASAGFGFYATQFADYQKTYGALGGVILLMMWLFITALVVLVGAEINAEIEAQTALDSTIGPPLPMGERGARKADTLGRTREDAKAHRKAKKLTEVRKGAKIQDS